MDRFYIIPNSAKDPELTFSNRIIAYLEKHGARCHVQKITEKMEGPYHYTDPDGIPQDTQCIIVLGGDGTLLQEAGLQLTMVYSEISSLECSPLGLSKASGLRALCEVLDIGMDQVIMVGDADNDLEALKAAGLAVAMGNANEAVKAVCDAQVADNNHDGCAQAIEYYMLGEDRK